MTARPERPESQPFEPGRRGGTMGWWGWLPDIPRNAFGRVCWLLVIGAVTALLVFFAGILAWGLFVAIRKGDAAWPEVLLAVFLILLFLVGTYAFSDALSNGFRQARLDVKRARELAAYAKHADEAASEAKRRLTGKDLP